MTTFPDAIIAPKPVPPPAPCGPYAADSWQARLIAEVEKMHRGGQLRCVTVLAGDGPIRWMVGQSARSSHAPR